MNAINFIKENGVEKSREVVEGAPEWASHFDGYLYSEKQFHEQCFLLSDLKRLVESVERIKFIGGIDEAKTWAEKTKFGLERGHYSSSSIATIEEKIKRNEQAIADYEAIGGEHV